MATGGQGKSVVPDYDECPVCRECLRDPRTLNCKHYFCRVCLEGIIGDNSKGPIKCPTCREVTRLFEGSGVNDLPRHEGNYSVLDQVAGFLCGANNNNTVIKRDCDICEKDGVLATRFCYQCINNMCTECENKHLQKIAAHTSVPLVDLLYCSIHTYQVMTMYCQQCDVNVCIKCALNDHVTHDTLDIEGVAKESRQRLQEFVETDLDTYQNTLDHVMSAMRETRNLETEFTDSMTETRRLLKELGAKLDEVERDIKNKMAAERKTLLLYETDINDFIDSRNSLVGQATYLVEQASDPELVEREKDFPRTMVNFIQSINTYSVKLPDFGHAINTCSRLEQSLAGLRVEFRKWNIGMSKILEIEDLKQQRKVSISGIHYTSGVTMDTKRQIIVARTNDAAGPLKVYDYQGDLQESLGAGVVGLTDSRYRGICMDTKRDFYMAPCEGSLMLVDRAGQLAKTITVGSNNKGVGYHQEGDCYLVSDLNHYTVYLIDPDSSQVTRQIGSKGSGPSQVSSPFNINVGAVAGVDRPCILVSDRGNHCITLFDISGAHIMTNGKEGSEDGQLQCPESVITDSRGRVVVCDFGNKRVVSFSTDHTGQELWECIVHNDWGGWARPRYMALDTNHMVMAIVDTSFKNMYIYA